MGLVPGLEWDPEKARANLRKHGVDLADAVAVFEDERGLTMRDVLTAVDEQRYLTARRATPSEGRQYYASRR
ncbi:MAG: hypothetical protein DMF82_24305 [Acidobacteria bacterium]|nr:MAG: hypothetical protein DMF82_24305 [Acidobacteriota bacterium]